MEDGRWRRLFRSILHLPFSIVLILSLVVGCRKGGVEAHRAVGDLGPVEPIEQLVDQINSNNEKLPTLRGEGSFEAHIRNPNDPSGKPQFINGDLTLLYSQPRSIRIVAKKPAAGTIMEIAGNSDRYWVILPTQDSMQWGSYANIDRVDPTKVPIRPDLVLEVLGILPIQTNLMQPPVPVLRFNSDYAMYMLVWSEPTQTHWAAVKEIWYDRANKLPQMVILYDSSGRVTLRAKLYDHKPVEIDGIAPDKAPKVATRYELLFPLAGSKFDFDLKQDIAISRGGAPNERTFAFPSASAAGVSNITSLDEPR